MSFKPESFLKLAVERNDSQEVRITLLDRIVMRGPSTEEITALFQWVIRHQNYPGAILNIRDDDSFPHTKNKAEWTYDYFNGQVADANDDFSSDRVRHILEVRQYLRDKGHEKLAPLPPPPRSSSDEKGQSETRFPTWKDLAIGAGTGIAAAAAVAKESPAIGIGILAIGGGYLFYTAKKNQQR